MTEAQVGRAKEAVERARAAVAAADEEHETVDNGEWRPTIQAHLADARVALEELLDILEGS